MSIYHRDKCTRQEALEFRKVIVAFLRRENLPYTSLRALRAYDGHVRIYTGRKAHQMPLRRRRRLIEADPVTGRIVYELHNEPIIKDEYACVYRSDWEYDSKAEQQYIRRSLLRKN